MIEADRDAGVTAIAGQPFELTWTEGKKHMRHVPSCSAERSAVGVSSVTADQPGMTDQHFRYKSAITAAACK